VTDELRVLLLEDSLIDAELMVRELRRAGLTFQHERVDTETAFIDALQGFRPDVVLSDNALPTFDAIGALEMVKSHLAEAAFIVVSGTLGEELAIQMLKSGVTDYVLKQRLDRLGPVVLRAVREANDRAAARRAEAASLEANERFRRAFEDSAIGMALIDAQGRIFQVNRELCNMLGRSERELHNMTINALTWASDFSARATPVLPRADLQGQRHERRLTHIDGSPVWVNLTISILEADTGQNPYAVAQFVDITAAQVARAQLIEQALHDPLTGLPNRALVKDRLGAALSRLERHQATVGVLFIDLDRFKEVNDTLGHAAGDTLLVEVGRRLQSVIRVGDTAGRMGGDEFILVCEELEGVPAATAIAERVAAVLAPPFLVMEHELSVAASVGIVVATDSGTDADDLIRDADVAMYRAKQAGGRRFELYEGSMREPLLARHETEAALRRALDNDELVVHFQPQVDLQTGTLVGYEALLRWEHPTRGVLPPSEFLSVAESSGQIVDIGARTVAAACEAASRNGAEATGIIAVNLSARQLADKRLLATLTGILADTGLAPDSLCVEITEDALLVSSELTTTLFATIRAQGVRVAIDDFGTGYASLSYLANFRPNILKIDKSFVADLGVDELASAIVSAIVHLADSQGLTVVAEGVETPAQLAHLIRICCHQAQGYLFSMPLPRLLTREQVDLAETEWAAAIRDAIPAPITT